MISLVQFIIRFFLLIILHSINGYVPLAENNKLIIAHSSTSFTQDAKGKVFQILDNKCNVCHRKRNKRRVFTTENMNTLANDIYKQVFIKKRMPKGNKIMLSANEYQDLLTWISSPKTSNHGI